MKNILPILGLMLILSACEITVQPDQLDNDGYAIETSDLNYEAIIIEQDRRSIRLEIPSTFTNSTSSPVYFLGCNPPHSSIIEVQDGSNWIPVYSPVINLCLSPPVRILPGESINLPSVFVACFPGHNCAPEFQGPIQGTYRFRQHGVYYDPSGKEALSDDLLLSNPFSITVLQNQI